jgi:hypothetical protein
VYQNSTIQDYHNESKNWIPCNFCSE